jgi:hypothetical protein
VIDETTAATVKVAHYHLMKMTPRAGPFQSVRHSAAAAHGTDRHRTVAVARAHGHVTALVPIAPTVVPAAVPTVMPAAVLGTSRAAVVVGADAEPRPFVTDSDGHLRIRRRDQAWRCRQARQGSNSINERFHVILQIYVSNKHSSAAIVPV